MARVDKSINKSNMLRKTYKVEIFIFFHFNDIYFCILLIIFMSTVSFYFKILERKTWILQNKKEVNRNAHLEFVEELIRK